MNSITGDTFSTFIFSQTNQATPIFPTFIFSSSLNSLEKSKSLYSKPLIDKINQNSF